MQMQRTLKMVTSTSVGRAMFKTLNPLVRLARSVSNPEIPNNRMFTKVTYRGRQFKLLLRRWSESDALAVKQCFTQEQYDMPSGAHGILIGNIYREIVASGRKPLIIDCGANIGASVTWLSARYPEAHIIAIEPSQENFELLRHNCAGLDVDLRNAGISSVDGIAYLHNPSGENMDFRTTSEQKGIPIEMISVGSLLASKSPEAYAPFLLKIDIEGAEKTLFEGDTTPINQFPLIILEPHDWMLPGQLTSQEFFRFHAAAGREFCMKHENIASITSHSSLLLENQRTHA